MKLKITYIFFFVIMVSIIACQTSTDNKNISKDDQEKHLKKGHEIALQTFATLGGQVQKAIKQGGVSNAINYCNLNASPLVDSLSKVHTATIRRVSTKARNQLNLPSEKEAIVLHQYEKEFRNKGKPAPMVQINEDQSISFFAPIYTNAFCLQCHGKIGESLKAEDYAFIKEKYPEDKAIGYIEGDFRGMWSINFNF